MTDFHRSGTSANVNRKPVLDFAPLGSSGSLMFHEPARSASTCKSRAKLFRSGLKYNLGMNSRASDSGHTGKMNVLRDSKFVLRDSLFKDEVS